MKDEMVALAAEVIRRKSRSGQLTTGEDIFQDLLKGRLPDGEEGEARRRCESAIESALEKNEDLVKTDITGGKQYFFSSQFMTEAYAGILMKKEREPALLIAEIVRQDSSIYPRPTPLATFLGLPFELTEDEIGRCLEQMAGQDEYRDIGQTRSSIGTLFLYSTLYLEPDYASMLAEWVDVGQTDNP